MPSWTLCFDFRVLWAPVAKQIPWDNPSVVQWSFPCLSLDSSTGKGFALKTAFYGKMEMRLQNV